MGNSKLSCLDDIVQAVDIKPVTNRIQHPNGLLTVQQCLQQMGDTGFAISWVGHYRRKDRVEQSTSSGRYFK
jgi:hypothetical protein